MFGCFTASKKPVSPGFTAGITFAQAGLTPQKCPNGYRPGGAGSNDVEITASAPTNFLTRYGSAAEESIKT